MAVNGIELAVGQVWRQRDGLAVRIARKERNGFWGTVDFDGTEMDDIDDQGFSSSSNGVGGSTYDIVKLICDEQGFAIWRGGEQPAETKGRKIEYRMRKGDVGKSSADFLRWWHDNEPLAQNDIVAYKIVDTPVAQAEPEQITTDAAALAAETLSALGWRFDGEAWAQDVPKSLPRGEALTEFVSTLGRGESAGTSALDVQIGGSHYKSLAIQPMEYSMANKLDPCQHTIVKYVTRFRDKGGIDDLKKARHTIDLLIEFEGKQS